MNPKKFGKIANHKHVKGNVPFYDYLGEEAAAAGLLGAIRKVVKEKLTSLDAGKMRSSTNEVGILDQSLSHISQN